MNIVLMGAAGTGKGTQTRRVADYFGLHRVASGELLRDAVNEGTKLGLEAEQHMSAGHLVPDSIVLRLVMDEMERDPARGWVIDGLPRNLHQARMLDRALAQRHKAIDMALLLEVSEKELLHRLAGRQTCQNCGATYHPAFNPPAIEGRCDNCDGELVVRADDTEEVIHMRLEVYRAQTAPVIVHYHAKGSLVRIDGEGTVDEVWDRVRQQLTSWQAQRAGQQPDPVPNGRGRTA